MKFLHTADWQIGMRCGAAGSKADEARAARLETMQRIASVANERGVDFVLVAGDLFDHRTPKIADFVAVIAALRSIQAPVYVLPGNHDPGDEKGPYAAAQWSQLRNSNVTTIESAAPFPVPGGELLASPCLSKYGSEDPTRWFASHDSPNGAIRIGVAHGSLRLGDIARTHAGDARGHFPIEPTAASDGRLDYLALGDWHGYFTTPNGNAIISYSGSPEPTGFNEDSGSVSIVTIDAPGAKPKIERVPVGKLHWVARDYDVSDDASVERLNADLLSIQDPRTTLVRAKLRGLCTPSAASQLRAFEVAFRLRFLSIEMLHEYAARPETEAQWLELLPPEFAELATRLIAQIGTDGEAIAVRALDKLAELAQ